jgi:hypothetical protein
LCSYYSPYRQEGIDCDATDKILNDYRLNKAIPLNKYSIQVLATRLWSF